MESRKGLWGRLNMDIHVFYSPSDEIELLEKVHKALRKVGLESIITDFEDECHKRK